MLPYSECPAANFHTDDLVPAGYPGMRLTTAEAQQVEETLAPVLPGYLGNAQLEISNLLSCLHPIPASATERTKWVLELQGQASAYWYQLIDRREDYGNVLGAFKKQDWTSLLMLFTVPKGSSPRVRPHQPSLQPLREALDERRIKLRREFAERLGCTCLNAPIKAPVEVREAPKTPIPAPLGKEMDRRSWYMPKETAQALAAAVDDLHHTTRLPKHLVLAELVAVALDHLPEVAGRLRGESPEDKAPSVSASADTVPPQKRVPFGSYIDPDLQKELRVACAGDGTEIRDALDEALRLWLNARPQADA
ncbi:hypothetical protein [Streptomyces sp. 030-HV]|uniref:hypothetical protein n=1 Tax=Streptomyces sp. 030-HV TaxID=2789262 RepID=UPI00397F881C